MKDIGNKDTIARLKTMFLGYPQSTLGIDEVLFLDTTNGIASAKYIAKEEMCHSGGIVQGGFVTGWIDAIMALACMAKCGPDVLVLTLLLASMFIVTMLILGTSLLIAYVLILWIMHLLYATLL